MDSETSILVEPPLPSSLGEHRHQLRTKHSRRTTYKHFIRAEAQRLSQSRDVSGHGARLDGSSHAHAFNFDPHHRASSDDSRCVNRDARRSLFEKDLRLYFEFNSLGGKRLFSPAARDKRSVESDRRPRPPRANDQDDGRDLARSDVPLPSDRHRLVRRPTLEREDAFRDESTSRRRVRVQQRLTDDAEVAELYRMGILYDDDKQDAGIDAFNLNSIRHEEPLFEIRDAKRRRKGRNARNASSGEDEQTLHLNLSFTVLGNDNAIAPYLASSVSEMSPNEAIQHAPRRSPQSLPPVRIIYEEAGSLPSFDLDTTQPPDLVADDMSDFDHVSEAELDDGPSQREIHDGADPWVMLGDDS